MLVVHLSLEVTLDIRNVGGTPGGLRVFLLGLVMVEALMERFPKQREGELAPRLNTLVSRKACAVIGAELGLGRFIIVDQSERSTGGADKPSLLANAIEAIIGAIEVLRWGHDDSGCVGHPPAVEVHLAADLPHERHPRRAWR